MAWRPGNHVRRIPGIAGTVVCITMLCVGGAIAQAGPPPTKAVPVVDTLHGYPIVDPYRWLEDQDAPETREWIDAQNEYTRSILDTLPGRERLEARMEELLRIDAIGMPTERNGRYFLSKRAADQDQYIIYMREGLNGEDRVLVDPHPMSEDNTVSVGLWDVSPDGKVIAYIVRQGGADEERVKIMNVDDGTHFADSLPPAVYFGFALLHDLSGYYYSKRTPEGPRLYYHKMGTPHTDDQLTFGEQYSEQEGISCGLSENGRWLIISVWYGSSGKKTDVYFKDVLNDGPIQTLVDDVEARFGVRVAGDRALIKTDWDAPNSRIFLADLANPARDNWREIIPETEHPMRNFTAVGGKICVTYLENVQSVVKIFEPDGTYLRDIKFPTIGSVGSVYGRWENPEAFFSFSSFHVPYTIYHYDIETDSREVWVRQDVPVETDDFEITQAWYYSKDSTRVPMFIVHKKDIVLDGSNPALMYGYGGFNSSITPYFSKWAVMWLEQGGIYVALNLRGGGEFGQEWHEAAMFEKKQHTFDDLHAAAEYLIAEGYTSSDRLAIMGGSNGGLLVGAGFTQRPDLYRAVLCTYPLLDMLRFHKFLMGPYWISEYGSADNPDQFEYIRAYSPYHNVEAGTEYPGIMFVTGDSDTRVDPMHARKMAALMQASTGSDNPIVLKYDTKAGHSGGTPLQKQISDSVDQLHFLLWQVGAVE